MSFENWLCSIADGNSLSDFLHDDFNVCGIFWNPSGHGPNLVHNESLQTNLLLSDVVRNWPNQAFYDDFHMSRTFSHLQLFTTLTICVHYETCQNGIYSKFARKSSNHLSDDDFHICINVPNGSLQISFCQKYLGIDKTICFIMILMSVGHSLSFSSLRCITSSVHYKSRKLDLFNSSRKQLKSLTLWWLRCLWHILQALTLYYTNLILSLTKLQISFNQNLLGKDHTRCFLMISMAIVHSLSFSSPRRITNSVHYESFKNWICLKIAGNCSNHLFNDDFHVSGIFR